MCSANKTPQFHSSFPGTFIYALKIQCPLHSEADTPTSIFRAVKVDSFTQGFLQKDNKSPLMPRSCQEQQKEVLRRNWAVSPNTYFSAYSSYSECRSTFMGSVMITLATVSVIGGEGKGIIQSRKYFLNHLCGTSSPNIPHR